MGILDDSRLDNQELALAVAYAVNVTLITTVHPWLANSYPKSLRNRLQRSSVWTTIFAFTFSYSVTRDFGLAMIVLVLHLVLRAVLVRYM